ncbi:unnamed protein product [Auanema sp. JU1783]|nr:unnamed protein product [Auanema sp. JU1783]
MSGFRRKAEFDDDERTAKRRKGPDEFSEAERKLQDIIARVGEKNGNATLESNLESLYEVLEKQGNIEKYKVVIADIVLTCVLAMPEKITLYSTFVGLLNSKYFNFGGEMIEKLNSEITTKMVASNYNHALYMILFVCDLGNSRVLTIDSIAEFLEGLVQAAFEESRQVRTDWFIYAVLHSLPFIGNELKEKKKENLDNILEGCERYIEDRKKPYVSLISVWESGTPHEQEEYLDCLWKQIKNLVAAEWKEKHIPRYQTSFANLLSNALQHNIPAFQACEDTKESVYPLPRVVFRLFDPTDCPESEASPVLPGAQTIERFLIEQDIIWILDNRAFDRKICAEELVLYAKGVIDVPMSYVMLEVIFGQLFLLPNHTHTEVFYGSLLIEMCKILPNEMPQVLAQSAELLYQRCEGMQPLCVDRFIDWFSFHLSNFQYKWSWSDWRDCLEFDTWNSKFIFAREVLEKCMRFSYYERVCEIVPKDFERLLPARPDIRFLLEDEGHPDNSLSLIFMNRFQNKATDEVMLGEIRGSDGEFDQRAFGVFFAVLLKLASKSVSHNLAALRRYHTTLKDVADVSEDFQEVILTTLYSCWKTNHQMIIILIDKLLKMQILDCAVVVNWIFSDDMKIETDRQWAFEVLNTALCGLSRHIKYVTRDVAFLEKKIASAPRKVKAENEDGDEPMEEENVEDKDQEELSALKEKLESLLDFQKTLFFDVIHKFIFVLTEHIVNSEKDDTELETAWYSWMSGRMKQVFLMHYHELSKISGDLGKELFTEVVDPLLIKIYDQFLALS